MSNVHDIWREIDNRLLEIEARLDEPSTAIERKRLMDRWRDLRAKEVRLCAMYAQARVRALPQYP